jgi:lipopolysaccharide transport system ATP-binding protein
MNGIANLSNAPSELAPRSAPSQALPGLVQGGRSVGTGHRENQTPAVLPLHTSTTIIDSFALRLSHISKCYRRFDRQWHRVRQWFARPGMKYYQEHWALRDVSMTIPRGSTVGVLGANGSGKSTLLQLIAGTLTPSEGELAINGRVAALLELGSGFHPEFTGWENVRLQAGILGLTDAEIAERIEPIARFSELGDALDRPLRTYSSGMILRLGFSIAVSIDPDILLVDEALAVGDLPFQQKCMGRIQEMREQGVTILLVTHDLNATKRLCDEVHVLEKGQLVQSGPTEAVCNWYIARLFAQRNAVPDVEAHRPYRHGNRQATIESWQWLDDTGHPSSHGWIGREYTVEATVRFHADIRKPVLGFYVRDSFGSEMLGQNTQNVGMTLSGRSGDMVRVRFRFGLHLRPGAYTLCLGLVDDPAQPVCLDWIDQAMILQVHDPVPGRVIFGLVAQPIDVTLD